MFLSTYADPALLFNFITDRDDFVIEYRKDFNTEPEVFVFGKEA